MTAPTAGHWCVGDKFATGVTKVKKIRERENIPIGTWNVRTLRRAWRLEELTYIMYHCSILGLCEIRWKNFGEMSSDDRHKFYFSGEKDRYEYVFCNT